MIILIKLSITNSNFSIYGLHLILIVLFQVILFFLSLEEQPAKQRVCEPVRLASIDWEEFKWLYKQQDSTVLQDSVSSYIFIRVNSNGTSETRISSELHQPWVYLLSSEIDSLRRSFNRAFCS